ncbi:MAG: hypothetical protein Q7R57_03190 [Dehalococcoidales bacterium]|nr:hypothetical protein [Dehalococcoidales bacterium]
MAELQRVGEVIESGTTAFVAQCYELYQVPPLGSLVKTVDASVGLYGIVCNASTTSLEPGRRPIARGKDEIDEQAIYRSNPQLLKLLRSDFNALVVGHKSGDQVRHYLPPQPARIHAFVYQCPAEEIRQFSQSFGFLNLLINAHLEIPPDELIAATLRQMAGAHEDSHAFLVAAGKELAVLLSGQYNQLKSILGRLK